MFDLRKAESPEGHIRSSAREVVVDRTGESANTIFEILADWEDQLKEKEPSVPKRENPNMRPRP